MGNTDKRKIKFSTIKGKTFLVAKETDFSISPGSKPNCTLRVYEVDSEGTAVSDVFAQVENNAHEVLVSFSDANRVLPGTEVFDRNKFVPNAHATHILEQGIRYACQMLGRYRSVEERKGEIQHFLDVGPTIEWEQASCR